MDQSERTTTEEEVNKDTRDKQVETQPEPAAYQNLEGNITMPLVVIEYFLYR